MKNFPNENRERKEKKNFKLKGDIDFLLSPYWGWGHKKVLLTRIVISNAL